MKFDNSWTLFLDRDGVINEREKDDYVKKVDDFSFVPGSIKAIEKVEWRFWSHRCRNESSGHRQRCDDSQTIERSTSAHDENN